MCKKIKNCIFLLCLFCVALLQACKMEKNIFDEIAKTKCVADYGRDVTPNEMNTVKFGKIKKKISDEKENDWGEKIEDSKYEVKDLEWLVLEKNAKEAVLISKSSFAVDIPYLGSEKEDSYSIDSSYAHKILQEYF